MGGKDNIRQSLKGWGEPVPVLFGFHRKDIDGGAGEGAILQGFGEGFEVDDFAPGVVEQDRAFFKAFENGLIDQVFGLIGLGYMERDDIGLAEDLLQRLSGVRVAKRE